MFDPDVPLTDAGKDLELRFGAAGCEVSEIVDFAFSSSAKHTMLNFQCLRKNSPRGIFWGHPVEK